MNRRRIGEESDMCERNAEQRRRDARLWEGDNPKSVIRSTICPITLFLGLFMTS